MQTSLIINSTDANGDAAKSITDVNSNADNSACHEFGRLANALTTHTFKGVSRVDKTNLDETKRTPTLTLARTQIPKSEIIAARATSPFGLFVDITYDGDGELSIGDYFTGTTVAGADFVPAIKNGKLFLVAKYHIDDTSTYDSQYHAPRTFTVQASEGKTCNAVSTTYTITYA